MGFSRTLSREACYPLFVSCSELRRIPLYLRKLSVLGIKSYCLV